MCYIIEEDNKRRETSQGIVQQEGLSPVIPASGTQADRLGYFLFPLLSNENQITHYWWGEREIRIMDTTSTSIVQDLDLLRKLFSIIRENESQTAGMTCAAFEEYLLKKLRDKKYNVRQIDQTEHLSLLDNAVAMICVPETSNVLDEKSRIIDLMKKNNLKIGYVVNNAKYPQVNIARFIV